MIGRYVVIEGVRGLEDEYIIKDKFGISLGRIFILQMSKLNKYCLVQLKMYKRNINNYLTEAVKLLIETLFIRKKIFKITFMIAEDEDYMPFVDLGFELEGVINDSIINDTNKSMLLFGINEKHYLKSGISNKIILENENISLKLLTPEYSEVMTKYFLKNKSHLKRFEPTRDEYFYNIETQRKILIEGYNQYMNGTSIGLGIFKEDVLIGRLQCSNIVQGVFKNGVIGYSIDKDYEGKGYMKEALKLFITFAFSDLELHRLEAATLVDNYRSQRVLNGCGFEEIGISKKYLFLDGKWRDHKLFCLIKEG